MAVAVRSYAARNGAAHERRIDMERLTKVYPSGGWGITGELDDAILRLAAYEETGLEPEDIKQTFTEETALKLAGQALGVSSDRLRELAEADKEGRCVVQKFAPGSEVWVVERDEDGEATEVSGFVFVVSVSSVAIVSPSINDCSDLDFILDDFVDETASCFSGDFSGYPISDCYKLYEEAEVALRREQDDHETA